MTHLYVHAITGLNAFQLLGQAFLFFVLGTLEGPEKGSSGEKRGLIERYLTIINLLLKIISNMKII